jgi:hypothetical protein
MSFTGAATDLTGRRACRQATAARRRPNVLAKAQYIPVELRGALEHELHRRAGISPATGACSRLSCTTSIRVARVLRRVLHRADSVNRRCDRRGRSHPPRALADCFRCARRSRASRPSGESDDLRGSAELGGRLAVPDRQQDVAMRAQVDSEAARSAHHAAVRMQRSISGVSPGSSGSSTTSAAAHIPRNASTEPGALEVLLVELDGKGQGHDQGNPERPRFLGHHAIRALGERTHDGQRQIGMPVAQLLQELAHEPAQCGASPGRRSRWPVTPTTIGTRSSGRRATPAVAASPPVPELAVVNCGFVIGRILLHRRRSAAATKKTAPASRGGGLWMMAQPERSKLIAKERRSGRRFYRRLQCSRTSHPAAPGKGFRRTR